MAGSMRRVRVPRHQTGAQYSVEIETGLRWLFATLLLQHPSPSQRAISSLASLLLRWKTGDTVFVVLSFIFQVWRYSSAVAMSLLNTPSTSCQSPSACMIARSSAYAHFLETVYGRSEIYMLKRRGARTHPCLLNLPLPMIKVKLRLPTIFMIMRTSLHVGDEDDSSTQNQCCRIRFQL